MAVRPKASSMNTTMTNRAIERAYGSPELYQQVIAKHPVDIGKDGKIPFANLRLKASALLLCVPKKFNFAGHDQEKLPTLCELAIEKSDIAMKLLTSKRNDEDVQIAFSKRLDAIRSWKKRVYTAQQTQQCQEELAMATEALGEAKVIKCLEALSNLEVTPRSTVMPKVFCPLRAYLSVPEDNERDWRQIEGSWLE